MSTYCHRIVEYLNKDSQWVRCGEIVDCFHGFDQWCNDKYCNRGFPEDATVKKDELRSDDGNFYVGGLSYITLQELSDWYDKEKENSYSYIFSELHQGLYKNVMRRLDMIANKDAAADADKDETNDTDEHNILTSLDCFKEYCEEAGETALMLNDELVRAYVLADQAASKEGEYWVSYEKIRIVYYYE